MESMPTAEVIDGTAVAARIKQDLATRVIALASRRVAPGLGTILVGEDPASRTYVTGKHRDCAEVGIGSIRVDLPADASQEELHQAIDQLNADPACTGFIVQLPLPEHLDMHAALERIDPTKDADGLHPTNLGRLMLGEAGPQPCTPRGILALLTEYGVRLRGADVCIIGCGVTVGRPLGVLLTSPEVHATVTLCHEHTDDIAAHARAADVVIAAAGVAHLVKPSWVRRGATVLSVGLTRTIEGILGDVDPDVGAVAGRWSKAIGGVGPMTRAMLLTNIVEAAERALSQSGERRLAPHDHRTSDTPLH